MTLKVIGAGLPRTATWSQKLALEQLGFGPCYHMSEALQHPDHWPLWERAGRGETIDWELIFAGWGSTTDAPGCEVYKRLVERYPDAKVILSVRDPEKWFASTQNTVINDMAVRAHTFRGTMGMIDAVNWGSDPRLRDKAYMLDRFHRHNEDVKASIPADRLLVYEVSQGWAPLCDFLGVPIPDAAFPQVNSTEEFQNRMAERAAAAAAAV